MSRAAVLGSESSGKSRIDAVRPHRRGEECVTCVMMNFSFLSGLPDSDLYMRGLRHLHGFNRIIEKLLISAIFFLKLNFLFVFKLNSVQGARVGDDLINGSGFMYASYLLIKEYSFEGVCNINGGIAAAAVIWTTGIAHDAVGNFMIHCYMLATFNNRTMGKSRDRRICYELYDGVRN